MIYERLCKFAECLIDTLFNELTCLWVTVNIFHNGWNFVFFDCVTSIVVWRVCVFIIELSL